MKFSDIGFKDAVSWVMVACAIATTLVVLHREYLSSSAARSPKKVAVEIEDFEALKKVGIRSGPPTARIHIVEFADFECPMCALFEQTLQAVRK